MEVLKLSVFRLSLLVVSMICAAAILPEVAAVRYIVGGNMGWSPNVNYTLWADGKNFYNGDWLFFVYDRNQMNVLEVNQTDYESCNSDHFLHNWTTGAGRDVVPLNVTRKYYFINGKGFCFSGMKVAIDVEDPPAPPSPSPSKIGSKGRHQSPPTVVPHLSFTPAPSPSKPGGFPAMSPESPAPSPSKPGGFGGFPAMSPESPAPSPSKPGGFPAMSPESSILPSSGAVLGFSHLLMDLVEMSLVLPVLAR